MVFARNAPPSGGFTTISPEILPHFAQKHGVRWQRGVSFYSIFVFLFTTPLTQTQDVDYLFYYFSISLIISFFLVSLSRFFLFSKVS